jgi:predicted Rossmann-fold nucleotide-binding protein
MPKMPVFLIGKDYWRSFDRIIKRMIDLRLIAEKDVGIFKITDDITEVVEAANRIGHPKVSENFYDGFREANSLLRTDPKAQGSN